MQSHSYRNTYWWFKLCLYSIIRLHGLFFFNVLLLTIHGLPEGGQYTQELKDAGILSLQVLLFVPTVFECTLPQRSQWLDKYFVAEANGDTAFPLPNHPNPNCIILKLLWKYYLGWWFLIYDQVAHQENKHPLSSQQLLWDPRLNWAWTKAHSRDYTKIAT